MERIAKNQTVAVQKQELGTAFPKNDLDKTTKPKAKRSVQLGSQMWNDEKAAIGGIYMPIGKLYVMFYISHASVMFPSIRYTYFLLTISFC